MKENQKKDLEIFNNISIDKVMRLSLVAKQIGIGISTIVQKLAVKGHKVENSPNTKLNYEQLKIISKEFGVPDLLDNNITIINNKNELENENLQEFISLGTHYALHNIKNAAKNMDWALQSINLNNFSESELENLKSNLKRIHETLEEFNKLNNVREQKQFEMQELENILNKLIRPSAKTKSIKFSFVYDNEIPKDLIINQTFYDVFQIFNNLIINAQKAMENTERKEVRVLVSKANDKEVWFNVCDTGVGISPDNKGKIFDFSFSTTGGTGIGLAYVRSELKRMGGQVALTVPNEQFSTIFEVKIPINQI